MRATATRCSGRPSLSATTRSAAARTAVRPLRPSASRTSARPFGSGRRGAMSDDLDTRIRVHAPRRRFVAHFSEHATAPARCRPPALHDRLLARAGRGGEPAAARLGIGSDPGLPRHALLPPCPEPTLEPRLPLATITVRRTVPRREGLQLDAAAPDRLHLPRTSPTGFRGSRRSAGSATCCIASAASL